MGKCSICGKKLGIFEGYKLDNLEYCDKCYLQGEKKLEKKEEKEREKEMRLEKKEEKMSRKKVNFYLIVFSWVIAVILALYFWNTYDNTLLAGGLILNLIWAKRCSKWASKIKKDMNVAYIIGLLFSLVGLIGYWIYYIFQKK